MNLIAPALGVLVVSAEAVGVARSLATEHGYRVDANRDLVGLGDGQPARGAVVGLRPVGRREPDRGGRRRGRKIAARGDRRRRADPAHGRVPRAALRGPAAGDARRDRGGGRRRASSASPSCAASSASGAARWCGPGWRCSGSSLLGVLQGLVVTAGLTLVYVIKRLARPSVGRLARDPATGTWGHVERHPDWELADGRARRPQRRPALLREHRRGQGAHPGAGARRAATGGGRVRPRPRARSSTSRRADTLGELVDALAADGIELRLANVRAPALAILRRAGIADRVRIAPSLDDATT